MKKIYILTKTTFHISNIGLILIYLYPGSIFGWMVYGDKQRQPQLTSDFLVFSWNHVYAFLFLSFFGFLLFFEKKKKIVLTYFFLISFLFEILHILVPNRSFQISDLYGNVLGVLISLILFLCFSYVKKKI